MRFVTPTLFFIAATYVWWYNQNHLDRIVMAVVIDLLAPATKGDPFEQGRLTVYLLAAIGGLFLVRDLVWLFRENRGVRPHDK